jgi:flagellar biosynthesis GTPase FlhF
MYAPPFFNTTPQVPPKKKKEKPSVKTPIPGTDWTRVLTTEGNLFYFHRPTKQSVWTAPEEILEALTKLEEEDAQNQVKEVVDKEVERVKAEVHELVKRKADSVPSAEKSTPKKAKVEVEEESEDTSGEEDAEEEWQREAAQQLAKEAEEARQRAEAEAEEQKRKAKEEEEALAKKARELNMPARVDLSLEEAKALFKVRPASPTTLRCLIEFGARRFSLKKISILFIRGINVYRFSFPILVTCYFRQYLSGVKFSMNIVVKNRASCANPMSKRRRRRRIQRGLSNNYYEKKSKAPGRAGPISDELGRKIGDFGAGVEMIEKGRKNSAIF